MYKIYSKHAMSEYFSNTFKSAIVLLFGPASVNLYYTFRPNSPLSGIMPFAFPLMCIGQYMYTLNKDF